ncbi:RidA family protein [Arthrobacter sp. USHLN218]|uniref:RidA family protein n=1 Tax=Arthrobacter sp. USHLN218 TaxID=3081232 RepID=UPI003017AA02
MTSTPAPRPQGRYQAAARHREIAISAGMTPREDGVLAGTGAITADLTDAQVQRLFEIACGNALAAINGVCSPDEHIESVLQMVVYVKYEHHGRSLPAVADFGVRALETMLQTPFTGVRTTVGVESLPGDAPLEVQVTAVVAP